MNNNEVIQDFDDAVDKMLDIKLDLIKKVDNCCIVTLSGVLDTYNSLFFQNQMNKIVHAGFKKIIISCENVRYISSTGVGDLLLLSKHIKLTDGKLILVGLQDCVKEVLKLLGFFNFFCIKDSMDDAIASMNKNIVFKISASSFPLPFTCPLCDAELRAPHVGRFRCLSCKSVISVYDKQEQVM